MKGGLKLVCNFEYHQHRAQEQSKIIFTSISCDGWHLKLGAAVGEEKSTILLQRK